MENEPKVCVILLNWNQPEITINCIDSIKKSNYSNYSIYVIDNDSSDCSYEIIKEKFIDIELYRTPENLGYGRGMNFGLDKASNENPDYYLVMNNDTLLDINAIPNLLEVFKQYGQKCIVTGKVLDYDKKNIIQTVGNQLINDKLLLYRKIGENELDIGQYDDICERDMIDDVFWMFPAALYKEIGGYSKYFFMNAEQKDYAIRAKKVGYRLMYAPKAKIYHKTHFSTGGKGNNKMKYWNTLSDFIFSYIHLSRIQFFKKYLRFLFKLPKLSYVSIKDRKNNLRSYAILRGFLSFNKWMFFRNEATSYNPIDQEKILKAKNNLRK